MFKKSLLRDKNITIFFKGFFIGLVSLSSFYYLLLFLVTKDVSHPFQQFVLSQPWMGLLLLGFSIQMGLYWLMKNGVFFSLRDKSDANLAVGTGTAVSGMAMVACCAHHVVDVLPILGLSAAAVFLTEYQEELLILGVIANFIGMFMMLWFIFEKPKIRDIKKYFKVHVRKVV